MADYNEQVNRLWDEWTSETGRNSGDPDEFIEWALSHRKLFLSPLDMKQVLRRKVSQALRQQKRYDKVGGFTYKGRQSVTLFEGGLPVKHYFDTDTGGTQTLRQKATKQRREAIANDVYRAVCDVEHMNRVFPDEPRLPFVTEFEDDVAERRAAENSDDDNDEMEG